MDVEAQVRAFLLPQHVTLPCGDFRHSPPLVTLGGDQDSASRTPHRVELGYQFFISRRPRPSGISIRIFVKPRVPPGRQLPTLNILDVYSPRNISDRLPNGDRHIRFLEGALRINYHNSANLLGPSSLGYSNLPSRPARRIKVRTNKGKIGIVDRPVGGGLVGFYE